MKRKPKPADLTTKQQPGAENYLNRELSQLAFNRRVLAQAEDQRLPLLERLRYLSIVTRNMDKFFEVPIASLLARMDGHTPEASGPGADFAQTSIESHDI